MQNNDLTHKMTKLSQRIVTLAFLLSAFVLFTGYEGALKSLLTVVVYQKPVNTFQELAEVMQRENWRVTVCCEPMMWHMGNSSSPSKQFVAKNLVLNEKATVAFTNQAFENVSDYKTGEERKGQIYAAVNTIKLLNNAIRTKLIDDAGYTDVHVMDDCFYEIAIALGLGKNSPYRESIDLKITQMREAGLIAKWMDESEVMEHTKEVREDEKFTLDDLQGPFLLHSILIGVSSLAFIIEYSTGKIKP